MLKNLQKVGIFVLSLYFVSLTPAADISRKMSDTFSTSPSQSSYSSLPSPERHTFSSFETRLETHAFSSSLLEQTSSISSSGLSSITASRSASNNSLSALNSDAPQITPAATRPNTISIAGRTISTFVATPTASNEFPDSGSRVGVYGNHFYYGHNTSQVFGGLQGLRPGDTFEVNVSGEIHRYRIEVTRTYRRTDLDHSSREDIARLAGIYRARHEGIAYDVSLMTCIGTSYGNGDASHRLVLFANEI